MNVDSNALITLTQARAQRITEHIDHDKPNAAIQILMDLDTADVASVFNELASEIREQLVEQALKYLDPEFLLELDETVKNQLLGKIAVVSLAEAMSHMETRDAVSLIEDMTIEQQKLLLSSINPNSRSLIEAGLNYPEDTVGRLASNKHIAFPASWTISKTLTILKSWAHKSSYIILLDKKSRPEGIVHMSKLVAHLDQQDTKLHDIQSDEIIKTNYDTDKEEVAFIFRRYKPGIIAVTDRAGKLLGSLTSEDILQIEHEEAEEDLMNITGAPETDTISWRRIAFDRLQWLSTTVFLASIGSIFSNILSLGIPLREYFMIVYPMIAAIGGATITQTAGITIRTLANRKLSIKNIDKLISRECAIAVINGLMLSVFVGCRFALLVPHPLPCAVVAVSMFAITLSAGFMGVFVPFVVHRLGLDPATTAGPMLASVTDIASIIVLFTLVQVVLRVL